MGNIRSILSRSPSPEPFDRDGASSSNSRHSLFNDSYRTADDSDLEEENDEDDDAEVLRINGSVGVLEGAKEPTTVPSKEFEEIPKDGPSAGS